MSDINKYGYSHLVTTFQHTEDLRLQKDEDGPASRVGASLKEVANTVLREESSTNLKTISQLPEKLAALQAEMTHSNNGVLANDKGIQQTASTQSIQVGKPDLAALSELLFLGDYEKDLGDAVLIQKLRQRELAFLTEKALPGIVHYSKKGNSEDDVLLLQLRAGELYKNINGLEDISDDLSQDNQANVVRYLKFLATVSFSEDNFNKLLACEALSAAYQHSDTDTQLACLDILGAAYT